MTIGSPKGPEREARPEESLRERVLHALCDGYNEQHASSMKDTARPDEFVGEADAVMAVFVPEVERLTAEVERLAKLAAKSEAAMNWSDKYFTRVSQRAQAYKAERNRLREQLATAALPDDGSIAELIYEHVKPVPDHEHSSDWTLSRLSVNAAERAILALAAPVSESVPAIPRKQWGIRFFDGSVRLQSGETPAREFAAHWKDAEVVSRPVADWIADPLRASAPSEASMEDAVLFAAAQDRVRRDKGERHALEDVAEELELLDEGRPSGSTPPAGGDSDTTPRQFQVGDEVRWCWTGANADGTWFKARLTEERPANYPKGWAGEITDRGSAYTAEQMGEVPPGFLVYMDIPSISLV